MNNKQKANKVRKGGKNKGPGHRLVISHGEQIRRLNPVSEAHFDTYRLLGYDL